MISLRVPQRLRLSSMPELIEILPQLLGALGDVGAVFQILARLFQLVGDLADGSTEGFIGGGVFVAADAAEEIAVSSLQEVCGGNRCAGGSFP